MQLHYSMDALPAIPSPVVTMGSFDGVHHGHRVIISRLNSLARDCGGESVLITFHPHPRKVLYPDTLGRDLRLISSLEEKCLLLEETGLDHLVVMEFTREFARTSSGDFVEGYLHGRLRAHTIVVGFNHFFGHNKEGNFDSLYESSARFGFRVEEIPEQEIQNETVSSTKIRKALEAGNIQRANAYLEHHFVFRCRLHPADAEQAASGVRSYTMKVEEENKLIPPRGSYAVSCNPEGAHVKGLCLIAVNSLSFYPLGDAELEGMQDLHFHKYLGGGERSLGKDLHAVSELIY